MRHEDVESTLAAIERTLSGDEEATIHGTGFWKVVAVVKRDPELVDPFASRIAAIDQQAFNRWAMVVVPLYVGTLVAVVGSILGLTLIGVASSMKAPLNGLTFLIGMGVLFVTLHSLAHLAVGRAVGIRVTDWFVASFGRPQPGVKIEYQSYLRASPTSRAWMHAAGTVVTKLVPFVLIPAALAADVPDWTIWGLVIFGFVGLITDFFWSGKHGDWKKFKREWALRESIPPTESAN